MEAFQIGDLHSTHNKVTFVINKVTFVINKATFVIKSLGGLLLLQGEHFRECALKFNTFLKISIRSLYLFIKHRMLIYPPKMTVLV